MLFPPQLLPDSQKTQEWARKCVDACIRDTEVMGGRRLDLLMYQIYYGLQQEQDYEYLTGSDEFRLPARVRFIPLGKPFFDILKSTEQSRPFKPMVYAVDNDSLDEKSQDMARTVVEKWISAMTDRQQRVHTMRMQIDMAKQSLQQQAEADPSAMAMVQQMEMKLQDVSAVVQRSEDVIANESSALDRYFRFSAQTHRERQMNYGLEYLMVKYDLKNMFSAGFEDLLVMDQEIYKVENVYEGHDPRVRRINPMNVFYSADPECDFIDEAERITEVRTMSISSVLDLYGSRLNAADIATLKEQSSYFDQSSSQVYFGDSFNAMPNGSVNGCDNNNLYSGSTMYAGDMVTVYNVEWRSVKKLILKRSKNGDGPVITQLINDEGEANKDEEIEIRYISQYWEGVRIGNNIHTDMRVRPFQFRDIKEIGRAYSSYTGFAYNGIDKRPYSRVMATKDIQVLYNLVYYQLELLQALGGIKGIIMDKAQIPGGMGMKEWFYNLKQGLGLIDSSKTGPDGRRMSFNQFQTFDMSFGQAIAQLIGVLDKLEYLMGRVIGIPPQRLGEVSSNDQVGTNKQAIIQSNITTEVLYNKHERIRNRVMNKLTMAASRTWKTGKRGSYVLGSMGQQMLNIGPKDLENASFEVFFGDPGREQALMDMLLQAAAQSYQTGGNTSLSQLAGLYNANNLRELQETILYFEGEAMKNAQAGAQSEADNIRQQMEMKAKLDAVVKKQLTDGEQLNAQLEDRKMQLEAQRLQMENQTKIQIENSKAQTQMGVAGVKADTEQQWMAKETRDTDIEARLKMLELSMDGLANLGKGISSPGSKNQVASR